MVYEIGLNIDIHFISRVGEEIATTFQNIKLIENKRCSKHGVCFNYALNELSRELEGYFLDNCEEGFTFVEDYFNKITIENAKKGDIITYHEINDFKSEYEKPCGGNCTHFAIIEKTDGTLNGTIINSKWGIMGVFQTSIEDIPDSYGNAILIWRKKG